MTDVRSYEEILKGSWDDLPEVKLLPAGSYRWVCRSAKFSPPKSEGSSPNVMFVCNAQEAMDDVSDDALAELGEEYDITANTVFHRIWLERDTDWQKVKQTITAMGVDLDGKSLEEGLKAMKNVEFIAYTTQQTFTNKKTGVSRTENVLQGFKSVEE